MGTTCSLPRRRRLSAIVVSALACSIALVWSPGPARASICLPGGSRPTLRVNAAGAAEVGWRAPQGSRRYAVVTPRGRVVWDRRMRGRDVSMRTADVHIPLMRRLRKTPDGAFWALQSWRRKCDRRELRFSRWKGGPTKVTVAASCCSGGRERLRGRLTFHGRAVYRTKVYLDSFDCPLRPGGWARVGTRWTRRNGAYTLRIRPEWTGRRYRATAVGPNFGWTRAPDARRAIASAR